MIGKMSIDDNELGDEDVGFEDADPAEMAKMTDFISEIQIEQDEPVL